MPLIPADSGWVLSYAADINEAGQIVGSARNAEGNLSHGFLYTGGRLYDLADLLVPGHGWEYLTSADAINDNGQVVGYGRINEQFRAFLMTPVP